MIKSEAGPRQYLGVEIKPGYSIIQFFAIILVPFAANALIADFLACTTDVLANPNYYDVSKEDLPTVVSNLNFYTQPA